MMFDYDDGLCPHGYDYDCRQCSQYDYEEQEREAKLRNAFSSKIIKLNNLDKQCCKYIYDHYYSIGKSKIIDESEKAFRVIVYGENPIIDTHFFSWIPKSSFVLFVPETIGEINTLKKIASLKRLPKLDEEGYVYVTPRFGSKLRRKIISEHKEIEEFNRYEKSGGKYYI